MQHSMLEQQSLLAANASAELAISATTAVILMIVDFMWNSELSVSRGLKDLP